MRDVLRYAAVASLILFVIYRSNPDLKPSVSPTTQVVAGALAGLAEVEVEFVWQFDQIRHKAFAQFREEYPKGSFRMPGWAGDMLGGIDADTSVAEAQDIFKSVSVKLYPRQEGKEYDHGRDVVRKASGGPDSDLDDSLGKCPDCKGTGKVGDGRVFTECLNCGGDGVIDDSDRKEEVPVVETSTQESAGDQISRGPACDNAGGSCGSTAPRVVLPGLRRLFKR